jgi:hypothetical protein
MKKKNNPDPNETFYALKYPDYHTWRDIKAAMARGGFWEDGEPIHLSDPEMQPQMDELKERIKHDKKFRDKLLKGILVPPRPKF